MVIVALFRVATTHCADCDQKLHSVVIRASSCTITLEMRFGIVAT